MAPLFRSASVAGSASVMSGSSSRWDIDCNNNHSQWHSSFYLFTFYWSPGPRRPLCDHLWTIFQSSLSIWSLITRSASPSMRPSTAPVLPEEWVLNLFIFIQGGKIVRRNVSIINTPFIFPYGKDIIFDDLWPTIAISNQDFPRSKRKYVRR